MNEVKEPSMIFRKKIFYVLYNSNFLINKLKENEQYGFMSLQVYA